VTTQLAFRWCTSPTDVDPALLDAVVHCWHQVSNDGGAVGFPFLPVDESEVRRAASELRLSLNEDYRLLVAVAEDELIGWLVLRMNNTPLTRHWGTLSRVQTGLPHRGTGCGAALVQEAQRVARDELGLEELHIEVRAGQGLEEFYMRMGYEVVGRWPGALRLSPGDTRDEVLMLKVLRTP
jgi:GNAT superfamily N-acetyltransferase